MGLDERSRDVQPRFSGAGAAGSIREVPTPHLRRLNKATTPDIVITIVPTIVATPAFSCQHITPINSIGIVPVLNGGRLAIVTFIICWDRYYHMLDYHYS